MRLVIFDLGGVFVRLDNARGLACVAEACGLTAAEVRRRIFGGGDVTVYDAGPLLDFETGRLSTDAFLAWFCQALGCPLTRADFERFWTAIFAGWIDGNIALAEALLARPGVAVALLTNTNPVHYGHLLRALPLLERIPWRFASFETGLMKPSPEAFQHVLSTVGVTPSEAVFIDDLEANVDAARALGLHGVLATSPAAVRAGLARLGLA